jgi:hypothetical protein
MSKNLEELLKSKGWGKNGGMKLDILKPQRDMLIKLKEYLEQEKQSLEEKRNKLKETLVKIEHGGAE